MMKMNTKMMKIPEMITSRDATIPPSFEKISATLKNVRVYSDTEKPTRKSTRISFLLPADAKLDAATGWRILLILIDRMTLSVNVTPMPKTVVVATVFL